MKARRCALPGALLAAVVATSAAAQVAHRPMAGISPEAAAGGGLRSRDELESFLAGLVEQKVLKAGPVAGAAVAVVKDRAPFFAQGYGCADATTGRAVGRDTVFRVGSVSKLVTWTALMQLVEAGRVGLHDPVDRFLDFAIPDTFPDPVTILNLLTHTGGFEENTLGYVVKRSAADVTPLGETLRRHVPARVRPPARNYSAGGAASYSNWATGLAGYVVERQTGDFEAFVGQRIFQPLGMSRSTFAEPLSPAVRAEGHSFVAGRPPGPAAPPGCAAPAGGAFVPQPFEYFRSLAPAASLSTTAPDMAAFMAAHLQRGAGVFRDPATADRMHARSLGAGPLLNGTALGPWETYHNGRRLLVHEGFTSQFMALVALMPDEGVGVFIAVNSIPRIPLSSVLRLFVDHYFPATVPPIAPAPGFPERAADYAGTFRLNLHSHTRLDKALALVLGPVFEVSVVPTDRGTLRVSNATYPGQVSEWEEVQGLTGTFRDTVIPATGPPQDGQEFIAFTRDDRGAITHLLRPIALAPAYKLTLLETAAFHRTLLGLVLLLYCVTAGWPTLGGVGGLGCARRLAGAASLCGIFGLGTLWECLLDYPELLVALPPRLYLALVLLLAGAVLTLAFIATAIRGWLGRGWSPPEVAGQAVFALASIAFYVSLNYWNLLGFRFA